MDRRGLATPCPQPTSATRPPAASLSATAGRDDELGKPTPCPSFLAQFASPDAPAGLEVPFGPSRQVRAGAPELDRVVALAGRDP